MSELPSFRDLPVAPGAPPQSSWGVFGEDDEVGTINLVTAERIRKAARLIQVGGMFSLNWSLDLPSPSILGRKSLRHTLISQPAGFDDCYSSYYPQSSSQWDALSHVAHPVHGFYNGRSRIDIDGTNDRRLGIDNWARRGIAGRFVLIDVLASRERNGIPLDCSATTSVTADELGHILSEQNTTLEAGDILLIRFGWTAWYESLTDPVRELLGDGQQFCAPGIEASSAMAGWIWDNKLAAVAADSPALEAMPFDLNMADRFLHYRLIPLLGLAIGELFDLDALARSCSEDGIYEGFFTAAPLNKPGGSGSPANALAFK